MASSPEPVARAGCQRFIIVGAGALTLGALAGVGALVALWRGAAVCAETAGCRSSAGIAITVGCAFVVSAAALSSLLAVATELKLRRYVLLGNAFAIAGLVSAALAFAP